MRALVALLSAVVTRGDVGMFEPTDDTAAPYGVQTAAVGESLAVLGWNISLANLRFDGDYVLFDVDASPTQADGPHAKPERHPVRPLRRAGASHRGQRDRRLSRRDRVWRSNPRPHRPPTSSRAQCVSARCATSPRCAALYVYSPKDRMAGTTVAYAAAFPVGLPPTNENDTGLVVKSDAASTRSGPTAPSSTRPRSATPTAFNGKGYMLLGLEISGLAARYRDESPTRGGPMMVLAAPTLPGPGLSHACDIYGASLLVLPDASLDAVSGPGLAVHAGRYERRRCSTRRCRSSARTPGCGPVTTVTWPRPGPTEWGETPASGRGTGPLPDDPRYDPALLSDGDTRNVVDAYRYWTREAIVADIDTRRHPLHVAIENFGNDANIGGVVRTANAFAVDTVHIVGRRRWNRRGAMVTDRYQRLRHHDTTADLLAFAADAGSDGRRGRQRARRGAARGDRAARELPADLRAGGPGHHRRRPKRGAALTVSIAQFGSTRSINAARRGGHRDARLDRATRRLSTGLVGQYRHHGPAMGKSRGQRGGRNREAASARSCGRCPAPNSQWSAWPSERKYRTVQYWHYWWQAHVLDCLVDAQVRDPQPDRVKRIERQIRAHRIRNNGRWINDYYDDMAWLALALERAGRLAGVEKPRALEKLCDQFLNSWVPEDGGGIPWRKQDQFFNAPANGPAGIFLARYDDRLRRAQQMADWIDETLIDPETHLVFDGIKAGSLVRAQYTYCQGVVLGLETELAARTEDADHAQRVHRLVAAVDNRWPPTA